MARANRQQSMGCRVGDTVIHCNDEFTIIDIRREESPEGMKLVIYCADPEQANKMQVDNIGHNQMYDQVMELMKKITDKGLGGLGDLGK